MMNRIKGFIRVSSWLLLAISSCPLLAQRTTLPADTPAARLSDDSLMTLVEYQTFQYFWNGAEPTSGLAQERIHQDGVYPLHDQNVVTTGGSGFGMMTLLVGIERGFITRDEGRARLQQMVTFLEKADRFHGAWPHWLDGETGKVKPFSSNDDGGDLVETAFLVQGLLSVRQYFAQGTPEEQALAQQVGRPGLVGARAVPCQPAPRHRLAQPRSFLSPAGGGEIAQPREAMKGANDRARDIEIAEVEAPEIERLAAEQVGPLEQGRADLAVALDMVARNRGQPQRTARPADDTRQEAALLAHPRGRSAAILSA